MIVLLTVDVEAHRVFDEISGDRHDSLGHILGELEHHDLPATFFVDVCGADTWGEKAIGDVVRRIQQAGHDVQLHAHPHHTTRDTSRWLLSSYSRAEQEAVISAAVDRFRELSGTSPVAFRAGGFGANDDTLDLLKTHGIAIDSSYLWKRPGCAIQPRSKSAPTEYRGVTEIPLTPAVVVGSADWPVRASAIDFNWLPIGVITSALTRLRDAGAPVAVVLLHSSSMFIRTGKSRLTYWRGHERRLRRLLTFLKQEQFEVKTITSAAPALQPATGGAIEAPPIGFGLVTQYRTLLYQSLIGCWFNRNYFLFLAGHAVATGILVYFLAIG